MDNTSHLSKIKKNLITQRLFLKIGSLAWQSKKLFGFFLDKKLFTIKTSVINQNKRVYAKSLAFVDEYVRIVYMWLGYSLQISEPLLIFMKQEMKINTHIYINNTLIPAVEENLKKSTIKDLNKN